MSLIQHRYRVGAKALILSPDGTKFLVAPKRKSGKWDLPGGGIEHGESPEEALVREIQEEMGLAVLSMSRAPVHCFTRQFEGGEHHGEWYLNMVYRTDVSDPAQYKASDECVRWIYVSPSEARALKASTRYHVVQEVGCAFYGIVPLLSAQ
jgi:8-oxo-dGTP pyrophosphatase MutT (NUDIX family)